MINRIFPPVVLACSFACEETTETPSADTSVVTEEDVFQSPIFPKEGVVLEAPLSLERCLEQVPSCQCASVEQQSLCSPQFQAAILPIPSALRERMINVTWTEECPIHISDLQLLRVVHWTEKRQVVWGEVVISKRVAEDARRVFEELYNMEFPIHKIAPAVNYDGSDEDSMADNNSTVFNCRKVKGTNRWSSHSYGEAIDINPLWNPYVQGQIIYPENAKPFTDRSNVIPGMINSGDQIIEVLERHGWRWGSNKKNVKDYQHFARSDAEN